MVSMHIQQPKVVSDATRRKLIDIRPVLPMVEVKEFQMLRYKYQLGVSHLIFPSATHTRMGHSFGAYHDTALFTKQSVELGTMNEAESAAVNAYALWHDIGHSALSHVTEPLCPRDNDEQGRVMIEKLRIYVEKCGVDFDLFRSIFRHENPLYLCVHDKNLGIEKLDYLERDGLLTIGDRPPGIEYLRMHLYFLEGQMVVDECALDQASDVQNFYARMFKNVYLRKPSAIAQRTIQKMAYYLLRDGVMQSEELYALTDFGLLARFEVSENETLQYMYDNFMRRLLYREAIIVKLRDYTHAAHQRGKPIHVYGADEREVAHITHAPKLQEQNPELLLELENEIAGIAAVAREQVMVVPFISPERFKQKDIKIYNSREHTIDSLFERDKKHFNDIQQVINAHCSLRVCALGSANRRKLSSPRVAEKVLQLIFS